MAYELKMPQLGLTMEEGTLSMHLAPVHNCRMRRERLIRPTGERGFVGMIRRICVCLLYTSAVCGIRKRAHTRRALFSLQAGFNVAVYIAYKN